MDRRLKLTVPVFLRGPFYSLPAACSGMTLWSTHMHTLQPGCILLLPSPNCIHCKNCQAFHDMYTPGTRRPWLDLTFLPGKSNVFSFTLANHSVATQPCIFQLTLLHAYTRCTLKQCCNLLPKLALSIPIPLWEQHSAKSQVTVAPSEPGLITVSPTRAHATHNASFLLLSSV